MAEKIEVHLDGKVLSIETGRMAKQADGAVVVGLEETMVLVSACSQREPRKNLSFFPLTCDYRNTPMPRARFPEAFQTGGQALRKRGSDESPHRPSHPPALPGRLCLRDSDRGHGAVGRPGDEPGYSGSEWCVGGTGPVRHSVPVSPGGGAGGPRRRRFILNPAIPQLEESDLNLILSGSWDGITMVEATMREVSEQVVVEAIEYGHKQGIRPVIEGIRELAGRRPVTKRTVEPKTLDPGLVEQVESLAKEKILEALHTPGKLASERK